MSVRSMPCITTSWTCRTSCPMESSSNSPTNSEAARDIDMGFIRKMPTISGLLLIATLVGLAATRPAAEQTDGQQIFRFDTFGDEQLWTTVLRMHEVIETVDPATALGVGLKVDVDALPPSVIAALRAGQVDLSDPAVTAGLLRLNAVV